MLKCGISGRTADATVFLRVTLQDIAKASVINPKLVPANTEEGLYQVGEETAEVLIPIIDERLKTAMRPEPLPPAIAEHLGRDHEMVPVLKPGATPTPHQRM